MENMDIYNLLIDIDNGYEPTKEQEQLLYSVEHISWNKYNVLPKCIGRMRSLKHLDLSGCSNLEDISMLSGLPNLINLGLSRCISLEDISALSKIETLSILDLSRTSISDINPLRMLVNLTKLDLSECWNLKDISALSSLSALTNLNISSCQHISDISVLSGLKNLSKLTLRGLKVSDISALSGLTSLRNLYMRDTEISDVSVLSSLTELVALSLYNTKVSDINALSAMKDMRNLNLRNTKVSDINVLSGLTRLKNINLRGTRVRDISALSNLKLLKYIDLRGLTLSSIPESLLNLNIDFFLDEKPNGNGIFIHGLTLTEQPIEIFSQSREMIRAYYKEQEKVPINECKVVFLGDGGAGKSMMIDRLIHDGEISPNFDGESTPGICISSKKYMIGKDEIELHFWDFGGQAIMHSMHRLFLTNRTLYVVVTNARDNKANEQAWYWIRNIKSFADGAPVFLIINQKDQNPSANVNENGLRKEYPALQDVRIVSALKDTREKFLSEVRDTLCRIISKMETVYTPFSKSWLALMRDLHEMSEDIIKSQEFYAKCAFHDVGTEKELLDQIISWYQDLGVCFYSKRHPTSKQYMVLKPRWLLNALYILVFNGRDYAVNGIIKESDIYELICRKVSDENIKKVYSYITYEDEQIQYILTVLLNYELIFRLDDEHFFIPMLCDENEPNSLGAFDSEDALQISYEYAYLPENVLHKLMIRHGYDLNTRIVWRTGAVFYNSRCGWTSLVRMRDNFLDVFARTSHPETHPINVYLDMMRESICKINESFGITAEESIIFRRNGLKDCFDTEVLQGFMENGQHTVYSKVFRAMISIEEILGIVNVQDRLFGQGNDSQINTLLNALAEALLKLQDNRHYYSANENTCNTYVRDLLEQCGYICEDQPLHGVSGTGKSAGSLDILIRDKDSKKNLSIYEAQKLKGFGKADLDYLDDHIKRLLDNYNARGFRNLLLISYVAWDKKEFNEITDKYSKHVMDSESAPFKVVDSRLMDIFSDTFMRCVRVGYDCSGTTMYVYHMIVRVAS